MDSASIYNLLGFLIVAAVVYAVSTLAPAAAFSGTIRFIAGCIAVLGVIVFILHFLTASGVIR